MIAFAVKKWLLRLLVVPLLALSFCLALPALAVLGAAAAVWTAADALAAKMKE